MKAIALALVVLGLAALPLPAADAYHANCQPEYPCDIRPCDAKCLLWHAVEPARCVLALECVP